MTCRRTANPARGKTNRPLLRRPVRIGLPRRPGEPVKGLRGQRFEQAVDGHIEGPGELLDIVEGDVANPAFDMGDEGSMQLALQRQVLLGPLALCPKRAQVVREELACALLSGLRSLLCHEPDGPAVALLSQPRLRHNCHVDTSYRL
jgi:hypothetical protein